MIESQHTGGKIHSLPVPVSKQETDFSVKVDVVVVAVVLNVVLATLKVDLRLLVMKVEFGWVVGWWGAKIVLGCC